MSDCLRIVFAGTPDFAVPSLQALLDSRHEVVAVYSQPDRPAGRGRKLQFSPVKQLAVDSGIPVEQPLSLKNEAAQSILAAYKADLMVVVAYGLILPQVVLDMPVHGCLNVHGSLLPRWRGAAPIQRAIEAGDTETGVTIMQMAAGLDTGDMLFKTHCPITGSDGGQSIHDQLAVQGAEALLETLDLVCSGELEPEVQNDELACYAHKLSKAEAEIDWSQPAATLDCKIRAFDAWPTAFSLQGGKPVRFFSSSLPDQTDSGMSEALASGMVVAENRGGIDIAAGDGNLVRVHRLQMPGGKRMDVADFVNAKTLMDVQFDSKPHENSEPTGSE
uniref:Methionyl-tRNA formyltransferase n=1 Tax=uncultured Thiotrichaceae bacterium TaxID=298394 RepID=A0A6S6UAE4_9GAMM|nr:MAG: Methionyl-tRNA formyltransferase (EC [uncultured Thiotrichaceae bacterium]